VAIGTTVVAPEHYACSIGDAPAQRTVLAHEGTAELSCTAADGQRTQTLAIKVVVLPGHATPPR
jgi:hypothetical protein